VEPQRFLAQLEIVATLLRVDLTDRSYRNDFTPNYRVLFDRPGRRLYIYELFNCFDCEPIFVNGKLIRISQDARQKGKLLKRCYHELLETVDAYFLVGAIPDLEKMRALMARFDRTWVDFEKLYFEELFQIEAEARAPVVRAMQLEHKLRSLEDNDTPKLEVLVSSLRDRSPTRYNERFEVLKQLVQLTAGLNNSANVVGRGRDDLNVEVLVAAADRWALAMSREPSNQIETYHREVQRVLSSRVLQHFADLRKYFGSISDIWKEVDPQLCNNRKLVDALSAWEVAWELGNRSLLKQDVLQSFSNCAAMTLDAQRLAPELPRLIDTRDAELFLILPRLVTLCALRAPSQSGIIRELLPHQFAGEAEADKGEEGEEAAAFRSRLQELKRDFEEAGKGFS
ncbi:panB, partial [Symbiodinium pilosum]